ncbi:hypothetical protein HOLleu_10692 [Holothuria leucospilota]|uniref:HAT C-terminal dimerisation domain-containing protein n=1 Tax=Holothuria leucospilota TaxID=206669 RepID=A0A9Q1CF87_HOLLE|nr:hypothetical protein HOLleu_10692 [Holothuria leucospilota]
MIPRYYNEALRYTLARNTPMYLCAIQRNSKMATPKRAAGGLERFGFKPKATRLSAGMLCKLCIKHKQKSTKGVWTKVPCTSMIRHSLTKHSKCEQHLRAIKMEAEQRAVAEAGGTIEQAFEYVIKLDRIALIGAMKCLYWLAKREIPHTTNFEPLLELVKSMGCDYLNNLYKGKNAKYTSQRTIKELLDAMCQTIRQTIQRDIIASTYFGMMVDETTDIAVLKQLIVFIRVTDKDSNKLKQKTSFFDIKDIPDGRADTITRELKKMLDEGGIDFTDMAGFGSDGASVMVGRRNGVASKLREEIPTLINIHCVAHRLALAAGQAATGIPYVVKFKEIIQQLYQFYQNSAVRMAGLTEIQNVLNSPSLRLKEAKDVRWLSHQQAVEAVRKSLSAIIMSLEREASERTDATAAGLLKFVKTYRFMATVCMLCDTLPYLSTLSRLFQRADIDFTTVQPLVISTRTNITALLEKKGKEMEDLPAWVEELVEAGLLRKAEEEPPAGETRQEMYERLKITPVYADAEDFEESASVIEYSLFHQNTLTAKENVFSQIYRPFLQNVITNLNERFSDVSLLGAFSIFHPSIVSASLNDEDDSLEVQHIKKLGDHYGLDNHKLEIEWNGMKHIIGNDTKVTHTDMMLMVVEKYQDLYPNMAMLASKALVIPVSTADCERGFSTLKRIKTPLRNRLTEETLKCLLFISIEGPEFSEFDFDTAVDFWKNGKTRILNV